MVLDNCDRFILQLDSLVDERFWLRRFYERSAVNWTDFNRERHSLIYSLWWQQLSLLTKMARLPSYLALARLTLLTCRFGDI